MSARIGWACAGLLAATALAHAPALRGELVYDDLPFIVENDAVKDARRVCDWFSDPRTLAEGTPWGTIHRPLRTASYAADFAAWRFEPLGYHLTSLALHLVAVCGAFALAWRLTGDPVAAWWGAAVFALHPAPSEATAWVGARADVMAAVPCLCLAVWHFAPGPRGPGRVVGEGVCLLAALACKESAAAVVGALAVGDWLRDGRPGAWRRAAWRAAPGFLLVAGYGVLRGILLGHVTRYEPLTGDRLTTLASSLVSRAWELGQLCWPTDGAVHYSRFGQVATLAHPAVPLAAVACGAFAWLAWRCRRVAPAVTFGCVWYIAFLLPVAQLIPLNMLLQDRWLHLPLAGLATACAAGIAAARLRWSGPARLGGALVAGTVLCALGLATGVRAAAWEGPETLWSRVLARDPDHLAARCFRGFGRARAALAARATDPARAAALTRAAREDLLVCVDQPVSQPELLQAAQWLARIDHSELALRVLDHGIARQRKPFVLAASRAGVLWDRGDRARAEAAYAEVLRSDPVGATVYRTRKGEVFNFLPTRDPETAAPGPARALVWLELGGRRFVADDLLGAEAAVVAALAAWPASQVGAINRARLAERRGRPDEASHRLAALIAGRPGVDDAYVDGARLASELGRPDEASRIAAAAVQRWPFVPRLWVLVAECAVAARDSRLARRARTRALDLDPGATLDPGMGRPGG